MLGEDLDGAAGALGALQGWGQGAQEALGCVPGPGDPLASSGEGDKNQVEWPRGPLESALHPTNGTDLAWEAGGRFLRCQEAAGNVGLVGTGGWHWGELRKGWGAGRAGRERLKEGPGSQEAGT